ncbi:PIN domain-containing protein [Deferrisoma palaeochoriense]
MSEGHPPRGFLVDTDVLVDYLRGLEAAAEWLESAEGDLSVSVITVAELFAGVRNETEQETLGDFLKAFTVRGVRCDRGVRQEVAGGSPWRELRDSRNARQARNEVP